MDDHVHLDEGSESPSGTGSASYAGAFFPNSRHFVIEGGTFTSYNSITDVPSDYLRIPLGSIDLRNEICLDVAAGIVSRNLKRRGTIRRMYSARVECRNTPMTVALFQGHDAEKEWRESVSVHSRLRHPLILQIYATASSSGIHAAVYHDDLIPFEQFLESFRHSLILQVYIEAYRSSWTNAKCSDIWARLYHTVPWVRRSTGRLCVEIVPLPIPWVGSMADEVETLPPPASTQAQQESWVIASLAFHQWYSLCHRFLTQHRLLEISTQAEVNLGSIIHWPVACQFEDATKMALVVPDPVRELRWNNDSLGTLLADGSVRCNSDDVFGMIIATTGHAHDAAVSWLSQANYILTQLKISSNYNDYVLINWVEFSLFISVPEKNPPTGYLFLCAAADFKTGPNSFRWPDRPVYWCLNPSGRDPLTAEEASNLGFPPIELTATVHGFFWDDTVYAGLRKFHIGKGVDPDSHDVARELDYPFYELSVPVPAVLVHDTASNPDDDSDDSNSDDLWDSAAWHCSFGELVELLKFGLIVGIAVTHLYEYYARQSVLHL
ncbi:hypothetical protein MSAN_00445900 [Mycena sanguinolenta]|uniref:Protein kinase domain-containing protein n=1 Tax=Mycena sanguinolenta TaxID=230812 RepID=A0A8H6ZG01_9AGAR|nr:hypothetical protein MSAN_00445900 [Mycena sanguinolenta]